MRINVAYKGSTQALSQLALAAASPNACCAGTGFYWTISFCKIEFSVCLQVATHTGDPCTYCVYSSHMNTNLPLGRKFLRFRKLKSKFFKSFSGQSRHILSIECVRSPEKNEIDSMLLVHMCHVTCHVSVSQGGALACRLV